MDKEKEFSMAVVEPAMSREEAKAAIQKFADIEKAMLDKEDFQEFTAKGTKFRFPKKSAFRKLALAFNVSDEILDERYETKGENNAIEVWHFTVKAIAPNGRYSVGVGSFSSDEREVAHAEHDPRAMAHTRAKNRAISDLIAGGILSAEEMVGIPEYKPAIPTYGKPTEEEDKIKKLRQSVAIEWGKTGKSQDERKKWLQQNYEVDSLTKMDELQLSDALDKIKAMPGAKVEVPSAEEEAAKTIKSKKVEMPSAEELGFVSEAEKNKLRSDLYRALKRTMEDLDMQNWLKAKDVPDTKLINKQKLEELIKDANELAEFKNLPDNF